MLSGFDALVDEEEEEEDEERHGDARNGLLSPPQSEPRAAASVSDLSLWCIFFTMCFALGTFLVDRANMQCWTARDELLLLRSLQIERGDGARSKWPLPAAHSEHDELQAQPLSMALSRGFCSVGVAVEFGEDEEEEELVLAGSGSGTLEHVYVDRLIDIIRINNNRSIVPHAQRLGACVQFTLSIALNPTARLQQWRALERMLRRKRGLLPTNNLLQVLVMADDGGDDDELLTAMLNSDDENEAVVGVDLRVTSPDAVDSRWWPLIRRFTYSVDGGDGGNLETTAAALAGLPRVAELGAKMHCPVRITDAPAAGGTAQWDALLRNGANMISSFDIAALEAFLRS